MAHAELRTAESATLLECLDELTRFEGVDRAACRQVRDKVAAGNFNLVVAGQFKRGKSSVVNALLGKDILPVGVIPLTSIVTIVEYGRTPEVNVQMESGLVQQVPLETLADYVTEKANPHNTKGVSRVVVRYPSPWLAQGTRLVDTPGIGSVFQHNTDLTVGYLPNADAVILVASADQPFSQAEIDFLKDIRSQAGKVICLLNKSDYLDMVGLVEAKDYCESTLRELFGTIIPLFAVSAKSALDAKADGSSIPEEAGFGQFETQLHKMLRHEKVAIWRSSITRNVERLLAQARLAADLEARALGQTQEQLAAPVQALKKRQQQVLDQQHELSVLFTADVSRLMAEEVEHDLTHFKVELAKRVLAQFDRWQGELRQESLMQLRAGFEERLNVYIQRAYDAWRRLIEAKLGQAFETLCDKYWERGGVASDELLKYAGDLFQVQYTSIPADVPWVDDDSFTYKFWEEPPTLKTATAFFVNALPRSLGTPILVAQASRRALELIDTQAGRIRYDLSERLRKRSQVFHDALEKRIRSSIDTFEKALERAAGAQQLGTQELESRRQQLEQVLGKIDSLAKRLAADTSPESRA